MPRLLRLRTQPRAASRGPAPSGGPRRRRGVRWPRGETRSKATREPTKYGDPHPATSRLPLPPSPFPRQAKLDRGEHPFRFVGQVVGFSVCCCLLVGFGFGWVFFSFFCGGGGKCELVFMRSFMTPDKLIFEDDTELCSLRNWGGDVFSDTRLLRDWGEKKKRYLIHE